MVILNSPPHLNKVILTSIHAYTTKVDYLLNYFSLSSYFYFTNNINLIILSQMYIHALISPNFTILSWHTKATWWLTIPAWCLLSAVGCLQLPPLWDTACRMTSKYWIEWSVEIEQDFISFWIQYLFCASGNEIRKIRDI